MPAASEPFLQRLKSLFKPGRKTAWDKVVRCALIFGVGYPIVLLTVALNGRALLASVKGLGDAGFAVSLMIVTIWYGGIITDFYSKLTGFGIIDFRVNRRGQDPDRTSVWMERIQDSKVVTIVGTLSRGWFIQAHENLDVLLKQQTELTDFEVFLLDPFGKIWRAMVESGYRHEEFLEDAIAVFRRLHDLAANHETKFHVYLYDTEPMSCVIARGAIYLGLYLPGMSKKQIPEFTISVGNFLGDKIGESVLKMRDSAAPVTAKIIDTYRTIMKGHATAPREDFWNDPLVYCDFCKEAHSLPSTFARHFVRFRESRIIPTGESFFVMPSLGPLVNDHALLVPRQHVTSSAKLPEKDLHAMLGIADRWTQHITDANVVPLIFEHGTPSDDTAHGGCGICHCHLHLLAIKQAQAGDFMIKFEDFLREKKYPVVAAELPSWNDVGGYSKDAYLNIRIGAEKPRVFRFNGAPVESQLMRKFLVSKVIGGEVEWDWRSGKPVTTDAANAELKASIERITAAVQ
jgi:diadenosine tetraphosphate (Ap4A) HIT family hydrolase